MTRAAYRKYHILYQTTCTVTGKFYIGMHSTDNLDDGYLGSGKRLGYSIRKHGKENHVREVLEMFPDRESLREREERIVVQSLLENELCMNLCRGGNGPPETFGLSIHSRQRQSIAQKEIWRRPGEKERRSKAQKEAQNRPAVKEHARVVQREVWQKQEVREKHRKAQARALADVSKRERHKKACKLAHDNLETKKRHSLARRSLTREEVFAVLDMHLSTGKKSAYIAKRLGVCKGGVGGVLLGLPCYQDWITEWKSKDA